MFLANENQLGVMCGPSRDFLEGSEFALPSCTSILPPGMWIVMADTIATHLDNKAMHRGCQDS